MNKEKILAVARDKRVLLVAVSTVSLLSGAAAGYAVATKRLEARFAEISEQEIAEAKAFYAALNKRDEYSDPEKLAADKGYEISESGKAAAEALAEYSGGVRDEVRARLAEDDSDEITHETFHPTPATNVTVNVFTDSDPNPEVTGGHFDYDAEVAKRSEDKPYVITVDEFMDDESGYEKGNLTYYEGDDALADEQDQIIDDTEGTVGNDNLLKFGHGSRDNNCVYVRNDMLKLEWEIIRAKGSYAKEVLGFDGGQETELKHSSRRRQGFRD